jgi:hypothetical protein
MKTYGGEETWLYAFSALDGMSSELHVPTALTLEK